MHLLLFVLNWLAYIPTPAKTIGVVVFVFGIIQFLKTYGPLQPYLVGWKSIVFNCLLSGLGLLATIPQGQLYTAATLQTLILTVLGAAGVHGTYKSFTPPTVPAFTPPSDKVENVPAKLEPLDPNAIPIEKKL